MFAQVQCESKKVAQPPQTFRDIFTLGEPV